MGPRPVSIRLAASSTASASATSVATAMQRTAGVHLTAGGRQSLDAPGQQAHLVAPLSEGQGRRPAGACGATGGHDDWALRHCRFPCMSASVLVDSPERGQRRRA